MSLEDRIRTLSPEQRQLLLERLCPADDTAAGQKEIAAYVVFHAGNYATAEDLRRFTAGQLPEFMVPKYFTPLPALPLQPNGKVNRHALPEPESDAPKPAGATQAPNETEARLMKLWRDVLRLENIGVNDNFFQLGGHSLLALQLMARVRDVFNVDLPIKALFAAPTVAGLAQAIAVHQPAAKPIRRIARIGNAARADHSSSRT